MSLGLARLALLTLLPAFTAPVPWPDMPAGWSDGYVYANGIRIHYYHAVPAPGKPVIVMIHGVTDVGLSWTTLTLKLQDSYDIYMVDTRGHGLTDPFTTGNDGSTLIKDVVGFVQAMKLEKPILMGHSMGAATVMRVGAEYPDLGRAIIMLDPGLGTGGPRAGPPARPAATQAANPPRPTPEQQAPAPDRLSISMFGPPETLVAQNNYRFEDLMATCRRQNSKWAELDCEYWALSKKQYHGAYSTEAWQSMSGSMRTADALAKITAPTLILKADAAAEARQANEVAARVMQNGRLVHVDGAGHNLHHDQLERTVELVTQFLSSL